MHIPGNAGSIQSGATNCKDEMTDTKMDEMWDLACDGDL